MDNLTITTYRYYTINDIGWDGSDEQLLNVDQSGNSTVYMLSIYDEDYNDEDLATKIVHAFEENKYVQSNVRKEATDKSIVYSFTDTDKVVTALVNIDTIAIFDAGFNPEGMTTNTYYEHVLSVGQLTIPMILKSSKRWDIDLTISLSNNKGDKVEFSISEVYTPHYTCEAIGMHNPSNDGTSYLCSYGSYSNCNIDANSYDTKLCEIPEAIKVVNSNEGYSYIYASEPSEGVDNYKCVDIGAGSSVGPAMTSNICIYIEDDVDVRNIHLGISQDHGIYAYYVTNSRGNKSSEYKIVYDSYIEYPSITCNGLLAKADEDSSPFVDDLYESKCLRRGVYNYTSGCMPKEYNNDGSIKCYNNYCSYTYSVDRGTCNTTINTPYLNYTGTCIYICNYDLYNACIGNNPNVHRNLMSFTDPKDNENTYNPNDVPVFNNLIFGSRSMPINLSILKEKNEDGSTAKMIDNVADYINCNARLALLNMRDTYNAYVSKLDSNTYWKLYDNAVVTYCSDNDDNGYHYINVLKYSALTINPVYRVVLPKSHEVNGVTYSYGDICINYNSNTLTIDTLITCTSSINNNVASSTYRIFYDTLSNYRYECAYIINNDSINNSYMYCLHGNKYYIHINYINESNNIKCIVIDACPPTNND